MRLFRDRSRNSCLLALLLGACAGSESESGDEVSGDSSGEESSGEDATTDGSDSADEASDDSSGADSSGEDASGEDATTDGSSGKLFEEDGVWSLMRYDLGEGAVDLNVSRKDAFLLDFDTNAGVVTTATCGTPGGDTPDTSVCRLSPSETFWACRCFAYAYEGDVMQWREFDAGTPPPAVAFEPPPGDGSDAYVNLSSIPSSQSAYAFQPLPQGVFGSDGAASSFELVQRAPTVIDEAYTDPEGACTPCVP